MIGKSPRPQSRSSAMGKSSAPSKSPRPSPRPADLKANYDLNRAMRGTESKAIAQDLKAAREDRNKPGRIVVRASGGKNPGANLKPMAKKAGGGMVKGYKDGGCVMAGRGGKYKGEM